MRRTREELAAHYEEKAEANRRAAKIAKNEHLSALEKIRRKLITLDEDELANHVGDAIDADLSDMKANAELPNDTPPLFSEGEAP